MTVMMCARSKDVAAAVGGKAFVSRGAAQAVSNALWSYAKLKFYPSQALLDVTVMKATGMLSQYTSQVKAHNITMLL